jgi:hypothetical protein
MVVPESKWSSPRRRGAILLELLITMGVAVTIISAGLTYLTAHRRSVAESYEHTAGMEIASAVTEMIRALGPKEFESRRKLGTLPGLSSMKYLDRCSYSAVCWPVSAAKKGKLLRVSVTVRWVSYGGTTAESKLDTYLRDRRDG